MIDVIVPEVGESITDGLLVEWFKEEGAFVAVDDRLFELETDKITLSVEAEEGGVLKILVPAGETVKIGQKVAVIDTKARAGEKPVSAPAGMEQAKEKLALSPAVRRMVEEHDLDAEKIKGTGKEGRVTKEDVVTHLKGAETPVPIPEPAEPAEGKVRAPIKSPKRS
ncbi:MAG: E3 binding domain-containing protein, partial [Planctomycetes bacterium]|nr:E3 binding domain-containing protein [Planctomycetota bacterium]